MDTITQALLGAVCGNVCARHKLGKRAARWGAVGGALPDIDTLAAIVGGPWAEMRYHRGFTHALWFGPVAGAILGWLIWRGHARRQDSELGTKAHRLWWMVLMAVAITSHPLLDIFTVYGTQIFAPLSDYRAGVNAIGIIDPLYSLPLVAALNWGRTDTVRARASAVALGLTTLYLLYGLWLNRQAVELARASLSARGVTAATVEAYPRVLQIFLRRLVATENGRMHVGQVSMWSEGPIVWHTFTPDTGKRVDETLSTEEGQLFTWFAMQQVAAHQRTEGDETIVEIHDMRYGDVRAPEQGMWGIRARFNEHGLVAPVERFRRSPVGGPGASLRRMWQDTFQSP